MRIGLKDRARGALTDQGRAERLVRVQLPVDTVERLALTAALPEDDAVAALAGLPFGSRALLVAHGVLDGGEQDDVIMGRRASQLTRFGRKVLKAADSEMQARRRGVSGATLDSLGGRIRAAAAEATAAAAGVAAATAERAESVADRLDQRHH